MLRNNGSNYRWFILALSSITSTFAVAMPWMSMTVLFKEISEELSLNLVQVGTIWGILPLSGILVAQIGGMLGDRFGAKNVLGVTCLLAGLVSASRGLPDSFIPLAAIMFLFGLPIAIIPLMVTKNVGTWFQGPRLALAQSVVTVSMALGFTLGTLLSATVFS
ncbi:MFS transporter, partial [Chloroflexota bacterium]